MLSLESQVCSLEYAKRLYELGVQQESLFCWSRTDGFKNWGLELHSSTDKRVGISKYLAFTVAEILHLLPATITLKEGEPFNNFRLIITNAHLCAEKDIRKMNRNFLFNYECDTSGHETSWLNIKLTKNKFDENPANGAAMLLIHLLENNLIKVEDINK